MSCRCGLTAGCSRCRPALARPSGTIPVPVAEPAAPTVRVPVLLDVSYAPPVSEEERADLRACSEWLRQGARSRPRDRRWADLLDRLLAE